MKLTVRYNRSFGPGFPCDDLFSPEAWDHLRQGAGGEDYAIPKLRENWVRRCQEHTEAAQGAHAIVEVARGINCTTVFSVGVGRGCVEYHMKQLNPNLRIVSTEYSRSAVELLQVVFTECDRIAAFDMTSACWPAFSEESLYLLYRVDTGLSDDQWRGVFGNMADSGVVRILMVATDFLNARALLRELVRRGRSQVLGTPLTFAGYLRSKSMFRDLWRPHYEAVAEHQIGGLTGFLLHISPRSETTRARVKTGMSNRN